MWYLDGGLWVLWPSLIAQHRMMCMKAILSPVCTSFQVFPYPPSFLLPRPFVSRNPHLPQRLVRPQTFINIDTYMFICSIIHHRAMHRDESVYPNANEYMPERFLEKDGKTPVMIPETKELGQHAFGFGRRSCIGYPIAK